MKIYAARRKYELSDFVGKDAWITVRLAFGRATYVSGLPEGETPCTDSVYFGHTAYAKILKITHTTVHFNCIGSQFLDDGYFMNNVDLNMGFVFSTRLKDISIATPTIIYTTDEIRAILTDRLH